jgi:hypothetical protein
MGWRYIIEFAAMLIMLGGVGGILYGVVKGTIAFSFRTIQLMAIIFVLPVVMILALERAIGNEAGAALIGTVVGYALSGIGKSE